MFKNYLKVALRNVVRQKGYSFINIAGLAVGMACSILIFLWVKDELSYDRYHINADEVYSVSTERHREGNVFRDWRTPVPLGPALQKEVPGIIYAARYTTHRGTLVKYNEKLFKEALAFADPSIFNLFTYTFLKGNPDSVFQHPFSVVITEEIAEKYFGSENPIGKSLLIDNKFNFNISGVIKNIPHNSQFRFSLLTQFTTWKEYVGAERMANWGRFSIDTFVLLQKNANMKELNQKISGFLEKKPSVKNTKLFLHPLVDMYLYSLNGGGRITYVYIFSLIALFVLIIACINFMNLSTARASKRAKEIGLRKVVGADRIQVVKQFLGESLLLSFVAFLLAIILVKALLPAFKVLSGKPLAMNLLNGNIILFLIAIMIFTGLCAGIYPALFLSSFKPVKVLKNDIKSGRSHLRAILVVFQFSLSIILIICAVVVSKQIGYISNRDVGFDRNNLVYIRMNKSILEKYELIKEEFSKNSSIKSTTLISSPLGLYASFETSKLDWEGKKDNESMNINLISVNYDFIKTFKLEMVQGRDFSREFSTDVSNFIVNEKAVKQMGMESPVGKQFTMNDMKGTIIGVVKDFNFESLYNEVRPLLFFFYPDFYTYIVVRIMPDNISHSIDFLERTVKTIAPNFFFEYRFQDEYFERLYRSEQKLKTIVKYFAVLAIFISCLGLLGLASFMTQQRTKEIGIRKIVGASVSSIILLLIKEFNKWVLIANIIAWPIAYYAMNKWLQNFAYRSSIELWIFILVALFSMAVVPLTVGYYSIKGALTNPVKALKYE